MDPYHLPPSQRAYLEMGETGLICFFALAILSVVPLIDGDALDWHQIGLIFIVCLLITLLKGVVEFLRPIPQSTGREVDNVIRRFERRLNDVYIPRWSSGPYVVPPPAQSGMHHEQTEQIPRQSYPLNTWLPEDKPTQAMPAIQPTPNTSQQIVRVPHHFKI